MSAAARQPDYDLTVITVGFDPRRHDDTVVGLEVAPAITVRHHPAGSADHIETTGDVRRIAYVLTRSGYRLSWRWSAAPEGYEHDVLTAEDGSPILEMRDPNDGSRSRYQYLVTEVGLLRRHLPAAGDVWRGEPAPPWWEPCDRTALRAPHILLAWADACGAPSVIAQDDACRDVVAYTPNGREVRYARDGVELQPAADNWWSTHPDLDSARRWWYEQPR